MASSNHNNFQPVDRTADYRYCCIESTTMSQPSLAHDSATFFTTSIAPQKDTWAQSRGGMLLVYHDDGTYIPLGNKIRSLRSAPFPFFQHQQSKIHKSSINLEQKAPSASITSHNLISHTHHTHSTKSIEPITLPILLPPDHHYKRTCSPPPSSVSPSPSPSSSPPIPTSSSQTHLHSHLQPR